MDVAMADHEQLRSSGCIRSTQRNETGLENRLPSLESKQRQSLSASRARRAVGTRKCQILFTLLPATCDQ